jgi:hypothetical protein
MERGGSSQHPDPSPPAAGGTALADGIRLDPGSCRQHSAPVAWHAHRIYRGAVEIGTVDYHTCQAFQLAHLDEIGLVETEQRCGIGSRVLACLRQQHPGYTWCTAPQMVLSRSFWARMQARYPGEYYPGSDPRGQVCRHLEAVMT